MGLINETTFGVVDGTVMKRTRSTDTLTEINKIENEIDDLTPRKINKMLHSRMAPPPTHFPETSTANLPVLIELYDKSKFFLGRENQ
uniref:Uncharacterized protein n=1 Tax=Panagrolaimus sp. JU765 TaxID=591449 RepID=A0AC34Q9Z0_9BILA